MDLPVVNHKDYFAKIGDDHKFPINKFGDLADYCDAAKRLLTRNNAPFKEINIAIVDGAMDEMIKKANGKRTIPQIFFDDEHIGGYDEVRALEKENKLQDMLK